MQSYLQTDYYPTYHSVKHQIFHVFNALFCVFAIGFSLPPRYDAYMDYPTFKKNLAHTGLTIRELAELLRMNKNSITNYAQSGEVPTHLGVIVRLVATLVDHHIDFRKELASAQIRTKRKRGVPFGHPFKKKVGGASPSPVQRPRFWYPADLAIPDAPVRSKPRIPPKIVQQESYSVPSDQSKAVKITRRGRKKNMENRDEHTD